MSCIRTKENKIIDLDKRYQDHLDDRDVNRKHKTKEAFIRAGHYKVVAEAETIEELCDYFAIKYRGQDVVFEKVKDMIKAVETLDNLRTYFAQLYDNFDEKIEFMKLGILTDGGIIFVADVDKNGTSKLI